MARTVQVYCTSFCNHGHRMHDGKPVAHECYIIPPVALTLERDGNTQAAIDVIQKNKTYFHFGQFSLRPHAGVRSQRKEG